MSEKFEWVCPVCQKSIYHKKSVSRHKKVHAEKTEFICSRCGKVSDRKDNFIRHQKSCKGKVEHKCRVCLKSFQKSYGLKRHQKVHESQKTVKCKNCGNYSNIEDAEQHALVCVKTKHISTEDLDEEFVTMVPRELFSSVHDRASFDNTETATDIGIDFVNQQMESWQDTTELEVTEDQIVPELPQENLPSNSEDVEDSAIQNQEKDLTPGTISLSEVTPIQRFRRSVSTPELDGNQTPTAVSRRPTPRICEVTIENSSTIDRNNIIMSPNTRQRKSRLAKDLSKYIEDWNLNEDDQVDVLALTLNKMGLLDRFKYLRKPTSKGRKLTSHETRNAAWKFWHKNSIPSTNTSRPAKLRVSDVKKIQAGLDFNDTVRVIKQRNRNFFESCWYITNEPYKVLFNKYIAEHPDNVLSFGSFVALKPFYVRAATLKDIEMCCCKVHLHARWSLGALIESSAKQNITLCFEDYYSFFEVLTADCQPEEYTHVSWKCVDKSNLCPHMATKWENMSAEILGQSNENITVKLQEFVMLETTLKNGKTVERLKAVTNDVNLKYIVNFISDLLPIIIHHRNHLKHYRNTSKIFKESFDAVCYLDIDFSENLTIPVKYEPQSLHWSHEQVTIHSGIVKTSQSKEYHPYISNDRKHDQQFVHICLQKMLENVTLTPQSYIAIESDNCSSQYKSCAHFYLIQQLSNDLNVNIIRIYGIAGHGKGEVDHVGGLAKTAVRKEVARGEFFQNAEELVDFLQEDLVSRDQLTYDVKEIKENELVDLRAECRLKVFETLDGSSQFQVMLFKPNCKKVHVAERLCVCESCLEQYGTCSSFKEVELDVRQLKTTALRSHTEKDVTDEEIDKEFILPGSICAIAANEKSIDTVWFVKIIAEEETSQNEIIDDYGFKIIPGQKFFTGNFLEKVSTKRNKQLYKEVNNKIAYVYKASIVYPFVNVEKEKGLFSIADNELCEIIAYVEHYGLTTMN